MTNNNASGSDLLLEMRGLRIEGQADDEWHEIVKGIDVTLKRGEVLGLRERGYLLAVSTVHPHKNWERLLGAYKLLREEGTERAGSSLLDKVYDPGVYHCRGCDLAVYDGEHKYDSRTGWPSFYQEIEGAVKAKPDLSHGMKRIEILCANCDSHLGHVFDDGPKPTGKRHCVNSLSLLFKDS